jgi:hypothetical protein
MWNSVNAKKTFTSYLAFYMMILHNFSVQKPEEFTRLALIVQNQQIPLYMLKILLYNVMYTNVYDECYWYILYSSPQ